MEQKTSMRKHLPIIAILSGPLIHLAGMIQAMGTDDIYLISYAYLSMAYPTAIILLFGAFRFLIGCAIETTVGPIYSLIFKYILYSLIGIRNSLAADDFQYCPLIHAITLVSAVVEFCHLESDRLRHFNQYGFTIWGVIFLEASSRSEPIYEIILAWTF